MTASATDQHKHVYGQWIQAAPFGLNTYRSCSCGLLQFKQSNEVIR